jgi:hypothetical protein
MLRRVTAATNRTLTYVGLAALAVILGLQGVIFAIWGDDGDPPDVVVAIAFVLFWGAVLVGLTVAALAVKRRLASPRS